MPFAPRGDRPNVGPSVKPIQAPPGPGADEKPISGAQGPKGDKGDKGDPGEPGAPGKDADEEAILLALFQKIKADPQFKGEKGDPGTVDYEKLAQELGGKFVIQFTDKDGQVVEERPFTFSKINNRFEVQIDPIHVQNFDENSQKIDEEFYPYPGPIKLRHGLKVPATTGPAT